MFFAVLNSAATKKDFDKIFNAVILLGSMIGMSTIIHRYSQMYGTGGDVASPVVSYGPFFNRNNFAGYIVMIIPMALGYALDDAPLSRRIVYGVAVGIMSLSLFLTYSRGGVLVFAVAILFFLLLSLSKDYLRQKSRINFLWIIVVFCAIILFTEAKSALVRLSTLFHKETFMVLGHGYPWKDGLIIWRDFPFFGTGLGTFADISSMYKTFPTQILFTYAHNDYLQLLLETGLAGFLVMTWFFCVYIITVLRMWFKRHDTYCICIVSGGLTSVVAMLVYSFLDFNLHIPASAFLFFIIMALVARLVRTRFEHAAAK
jgi:O-antigen ligase